MVKITLTKQINTHTQTHRIHLSIYEQTPGIISYYLQSRHTSSTASIIPGHLSHKSVTAVSVPELQNNLWSSPNL